MNKRGQFYFIAAIIIISLTAGFVTLSNYVSSQQTSDIYYLRDEIKIESSRAMDYIALNSEDFKETMTDFSRQYTDNLPGNNFYFIFGTENSATFMAYQSFAADVTLDSVEEPIGTGSIYIDDFVPAGDEVTLAIDGNTHIFKLNIGNNYGFIVSGKKGGQTYTARG
jgi:hypothetical protein